MVYTLSFFPLQNAVCFIILTYLVPVILTFYIQDVLKLKKNNSGSTSLSAVYREWKQNYWVLTYLVPVLFTFYIQGVLKNNSVAKRLKKQNAMVWTALHGLRIVSSGGLL
jgi:hypothetical protein